MKVIIKGREYEFDFGSVWGPTYTYEVLTSMQLPYNPQSTLCNHIMCYGILVRSNPGMTLGFEEFIEALNDVKLSKQLLDYYFKRLGVLAQLGKEEDGADSEKKKNGR